MEDSTPRLPYDCARCLDEECPERLRCLRYLCREAAGEQTPFYPTLNPHAEAACPEFWPFSQ